MKKSKPLPTKPDPKAQPATQLAQALFECLKGPGRAIPTKWQDDSADILRPLLAVHGFATVQAVMVFLFTVEGHFVDILLRIALPDQTSYFAKHFKSDLLPSYNEWMSNARGHAA